jgi:hypothetical protein
MKYIYWAGVKWGQNDYDFESYKWKEDPLAQVSLFVVNHEPGERFNHRIEEDNDIGFVKLNEGFYESHIHVLDGVLKFKTREEAMDRVVSHFPDSILLESVEIAEALSILSRHAIRNNRGFRIIGNNDGSMDLHVEGTEPKHGEPGEILELSNRFKV